MLPGSTYTGRPASSASANCCFGLEVEVVVARLVQVHRVGDVPVGGEAVAEDRAAPVQVGAHAARRREVPGEQVHVRDVAGEHRSDATRRRTASAPRRGWSMYAPQSGIGTAAPTQLNCCTRAREPGVVHRVADQVRVRRVLEDADAAAHHRARAAHRALEGGDLLRRAVRPREPDARAHVELVRRHVVPRLEDLLDVGVERRRGVELVAVEPEAVLDLQVVRAAPRVTEGERRR